MNKEVKIAVYGFNSDKEFIAKIQRYCHNRHNKYVGEYHFKAKCYIVTTDDVIYDNVIYDNVVYKYYYIAKYEIAHGMAFDKVLVVDDCLFDLRTRVSSIKDFEFIHL